MRFPIRPGIAIFSLAVVAGWMAIFASWDDRIPPALHHSGMFQGDMPTYLCYARMTQESATTLNYHSPHDIRPDAPQMMVNLPITLMGWMLRLGMSPPDVEMSLRWIFGFTMFASLGLVVAQVFRSRRWLWPVLLMVTLGGGIAWLLAWHDLSEPLPLGLDRESAEHALDRLRPRWFLYEQQYYWWFLNTFRNVMYPLECIYHTLVFTQLYALMRRNWRLANAMHILGMLSNPYVGIQMSALQGTTMLFARNAPWRQRWLCVPTTLLFLIYYSAILPSDPIMASLAEQHMHHLSQSLPPISMLTGWGFALLGVAAFALHRAFRRHIVRQWNAVPILCLAATVILLSQNSRIDWKLILEPMHFTRGYDHVSLWILFFLWLHYVAHRLRPMRVLTVVLLPLAIATSLPDNVLFLRDQYRFMPHRSSLVWDEHWQAVLESLATIPERKHVVVHNYEMGRLVCAMTPHHSAFGTEITTPDYTERVEELASFAAHPENEPPIIQWADIVIANGALRLALATHPNWRVRAENPTWAVYERTELTP